MAAVPKLGKDPESGRNLAPASQVREWARAQGLSVGSRGHFKPEVIKAFNRRHRTIYLDRNPARAAKEVTE